MSIEYGMKSISQLEFHLLYLYKSNYTFISHLQNKYSSNIYLIYLFFYYNQYYI